MTVSVNADDSEIQNADAPQPTVKRTRKPRSKAREVNEQQLEALHDKFAGATYMVLAHALPVPPTSDEMDSFFLPLERIGLRHMPEPFKNATPDQKDASLALLALAKYAARGYIVPAVMGQAMRQAQTTRRSTNAQASTPTPTPAPTPTPEPASVPTPASPRPARKTPKKSNNEAQGFADAIDSSQLPNDQLKNLHGYLTAFPTETGS